MSAINYQDLPTDIHFHIANYYKRNSFVVSVNIGHYNNTNYAIKKILSTISIDNKYTPYHTSDIPIQVFSKTSIPSGYNKDTYSLYPIPRRSPFLPATKSVLPATKSVLPATKSVLPATSPFYPRRSPFYPRRPLPANSTRDEVRLTSLSVSPFHDRACLGQRYQSTFLSRRSVQKDLLYASYHPNYI